MKPIQSYVAQYVLRLREADWHCTCRQCAQDDPFVIIDWQDQRRYSASMACDSVAQALLFSDDAFILHSAEEQAVDAEAPDECLQAINQGCINLAIADAAETRLKLYAIGVFLSQMAKLSSAEQVVASAEQLHQLLAQGSVAEQFAQLPAIDKYQLQAVRAISESGLAAQLDAQAGMVLGLKLNEFKVLADNYLQQTLRELEQDSRVSDFMQTHASVWQNFILYHCYHHFFPLQQPQAFLSLCVTFYLVKTLCGLLIQHDIALDESRLSALFAALERQPVALTCDADGLLVGFSLLK